MLPCNLHHRRRLIFCLGVTLAIVKWGLVGPAAEPARGAEPTKTAESLKSSPGDFNVVVMDPLALPLSCPCVKGYAQRDYDQLGAYLEKVLKRKVTVVYSESLAKAQDKLEGGDIDLVIGKRSVVAHDLAVLKVRAEPVAALTGKDGAITQTGLIVVPSGDAAKMAADLKGYRIIFGPPDCDEKHTAALAVLKKAGVKPPSPMETSNSCSDGATMILEFEKGVRGAAVISSYAKPLLEGCGTIKKGDLRVVAETVPVPFITAFLGSGLPESLREKVTTALLDAGDDPALCIALETQAGFVELDAPDTTENAAAPKKN